MRYRTLIVCLLAFAITWGGLDYVSPLGATPKWPAPALGSFNAPVVVTGVILAAAEIDTAAFSWPHRYDRAWGASGREPPAYRDDRACSASSLP